MHACDVGLSLRDEPTLASPVTRGTSDGRAEGCCSDYFSVAVVKY